MKRRKFLKWTGGLFLSSLVVGCGGADSDIVILPNQPGNPQPVARLSESTLFETNAEGRLLEIDAFL